MELYNYKVLPADICDYLINLYESDIENHERVNNQSKPTFTQLNLNKYHANIISNLCNYFSSLSIFINKMFHKQSIYHK